MSDVKKRQRLKLNGGGNLYDGWPLVARQGGDSIHTTHLLGVAGLPEFQSRADILLCIGNARRSQQAEVRVQSSTIARATDQAGNAGCLSDRLTLLRRAPICTPATNDNLHPHRTEALTHSKGRHRKATSKDACASCAALPALQPLAQFAYPQVRAVRADDLRDVEHHFMTAGAALCEQLARRRVDVAD